MPYVVGLTHLKSLLPKTSKPNEDVLKLFYVHAVQYVTYFIGSCTRNLQLHWVFVFGWSVCSASSEGKSQKLLAAVNFWWPINYNVKSLTSTMILEKPNVEFQGLLRI